MPPVSWLLLVPVVTSLAAVALWGSFRLSQRNKEIIVTIVFLVFVLLLPVPSH